MSFDSHEDVEAATERSGEIRGLKILCDSLANELRLLVESNERVRVVSYAGAKRVLREYDRIRLK